MVLARDDLSLVGELPLPERSVIVGQVEGRLIVHARDGTLQTIDITDPAAPALLERRSDTLVVELHDEALFYRHTYDGPLVRWEL